MSRRFPIATRSEVLARNAAHDGAIGAALGLLLVSGLVATHLGMAQGVADSGAPLMSLATLVGVVVAECAIATGICGAAGRRFFDLD